MGFDAVDNIVLILLQGYAASECSPNQPPFSFFQHTFLAMSLFWPTHPIFICNLPVQPVKSDIRQQLYMNDNLKINFYKKASLSITVTWSFPKSDGYYIQGPLQQMRRKASQTMFLTSFGFFNSQQQDKFVMATAHYKRNHKLCRGSVQKYKVGSS